MRSFLIALGLMALLGACSRPSLQEQQAYVFGTRVEVIVASPDPAQGQRAIAAVLRAFDHLHRSYHAWQASELTALNQAIGQTRQKTAGKPSTPVEVSPELADFVREAQLLSRQSDYLFDPGIGRLIALWGFQSDEFKNEPPTSSAVRGWLAERPSIKDLVIEGNTIGSTNPTVALDFGGYLKGVALDQATRILRAEGINNALINIGGNVMALGTKDGKKWRVGIQHPRQPGPMATISLDDGEAIGTSGDYQRFFEFEGRRYPHLLDPRSGYPVDHTQAVTVVIPAGPKAGTLSDASSKPIFIAGPDHWRDMAQKTGIGLVLRVDQNGQVFVTEALSKRLEFVSKPDKFSIVP